ncbi:hypothetical protein M3Y99_01832200 [Aphelenchoides fujianensis]|nr:hypothetical protein M3Y99_01832200 [Aphelenchoides fujianensis]
MKFASLWHQFALVVVLLVALSAAVVRAEHGDSGPCVDRGQFCTQVSPSQMAKFCHDPKYKKLISAECKATCRLC